MKAWTLGRVGFVLGHLENFVEHAHDDEHLRVRVREFSPQTGLAEVERLGLGDPLDPKLPELLLERLAPFFDSGVLIQNELDGWVVTDVFGRGATFHLSPDERIAAARVVPEAAPLDVRRTPAPGVLRALDLDCLLPAPDATAYVLKPTPAVCVLLVSRLAPVFAFDHVAAARRLVNESFLY